MFSLFVIVLCVKSAPTKIPSAIYFGENVTVTIHNDHFIETQSTSAGDATHETEFMWGTADLQLKSEKCEKVPYYAVEHEGVLGIEFVFSSLAKFEEDSPDLKIVGGRDNIARVLKEGGGACAENLVQPPEEDSIVELRSFIYESNHPNQIKYIIERDDSDTAKTLILRAESGSGASIVAVIVFIVLSVVICCILAVIAYVLLSNKKEEPGQLEPSQPRSRGPAE